MAAIINEELDENDPSLQLFLKFERVIAHPEYPAQAARQMCEAILSAGLDVNFVVPPHNFTLLRIAAMNGNLVVTQFLLEKNASVNINDGGPSPLQLAITSGKKEVVDLLLKHQADIHYRDRGGKTALNYAAREGNVEFTQLLLSKNADPKTKTKLQENAIISCLEACIDFSQNGKVVKEPEHFKKLHEVIQILVKAGVDINYWIDFTVPNEAGQRVNHPLCGYTPVMIACLLGNQDLVKGLVAMGANLNLVTKSATDNQLCAFRAAYYGQNAQMMKTLAALGSIAEVTAKDIQKFAQLKTQTQAGISPGESKEAFERRKLFFNTFDVITDLFHFAKKGVAKTSKPIMQLFKEGASFNQRTGDGRLNSPLHLACEHNQIEALRHLLAVLRTGKPSTQMAILSLQNAANQTPLDIAANKADPKIAHILMDVMQPLVDDVIARISSYKALGKLSADLMQHILCFAEKTPEPLFANQEAGAKLCTDVFNKSSAQFHFNLGLAFANGGNVPVNLTQAAVHFMRASKMQHKEAHYNLALYYLKGQGVKQSTKHAIHHAKQVGDLGLSDGYYLIADIYRYGAPNQPIDEQKWLHFLKQAAGLGCAKAISDLDIYAQSEKKKQEEALQNPNPLIFQKPGENGMKGKEGENGINGDNGAKMVQDKASQAKPPQAGPLQSSTSDSSALVTKGNNP